MNSKRRVQDPQSTRVMRAGHEIPASMKRWRKVRVRSCTNALLVDNDEETQTFLALASGSEFPIIFRSVTDSSVPIYSAWHNNCFLAGSFGGPGTSHLSTPHMTMAGQAKRDLSSHMPTKKEVKNMKLYGKLCSDEHNLPYVEWFIMFSVRASVSICGTDTRKFCT